MTQNDPTLECGLPNWRDADSYTNCFGRPDQWSEKRWRWEFKRRQPEYRDAFGTYVQQRRDGSIVRDHVEKINENGHRVMVAPSETVKASSEHSNELGFVFVADAEELERFQMYFLPNPRFSHQPNQTLLFGDRLSTAQRDEEGILVGEATYHFDLTLPLKPQILRCEELISRCQVEWKGKKLREQKREDKWFQYLRALDARENGASYSQMLEILPMKNNIEQSARDTYEAAIALRNKF